MAWKTGAALIRSGKRQRMSSLSPQGIGAESERHASTPVPDRPKTVIEISPRQKRLLDAAVEIEREDAASVGAIGFAARVWTQLALPYRDPGDVSRWERRNGNLTLVVRPATLIGPDGETRDAYPYGVIPRYLLAWMATEAVRTQNPHLDMGASFNQFMTKVGLSKGGANTRRLKEQIARLVGATMQVQDVRREGAGQRVKGQTFNVAESFELWIPDNESIDESQGALWNNTVTLSPQFYRSIVESPVPVDLRALRAFSGSPMRLDIYTWLTYRMSYMSSPTLISWESLAVQFGSTTHRLRKFRENFMDNINAVRVLYPAARFRPVDKGLWLYPSATHVAKKDQSQIEGEGR